MIWENNDFITKVDLGIAYRKAKADLFYERIHPNSFALCEYEENLEQNLNNLYKKLMQDSLDWMEDKCFVGDWAVIPKKIRCHDDRDNKKHFTWRPTNPDRIWETIVENGETEKPVAEFRQVGIHSIDFHVVSTLWMLKVGHIFDSILGPEAYGGRLRRQTSTSDGDLNRLSMGTFKPYLFHYRSWRDNGLKVMRDALDNGKRIVAITMDVRHFYHRLSPDFLLNEEFYEAVGIKEKLHLDELKFTSSLVKALHSWAAETPLHCKDQTVGIPVGLPVSRLISNVALAELDRVIVSQLQPLYYGRYVDDILLVIEDTQNFMKADDVWDYIVKRTEDMLCYPKKDNNINGKFSIEFKRKYLGNSRIIFSDQKQKIFLLEGSTGTTLIKSIEKQINNRSSEWRSLPELPDTPDALSSDLTFACDSDGEEVDNLRKADTISTRRAMLAIRLRDIEAFEQDLESKAWKKQRKSFFENMRNYIITLPQFFDMASYIPRLLGIAISCRDYEEAFKLLSRLIEVIGKVETDCLIEISGDNAKLINKHKILFKWREYMAQKHYEVMSAALDSRHERDKNKIEKILSKLMEVRINWEVGFNTIYGYEESMLWGKRLYFHDLGRRPFRMQYLNYGYKIYHKSQIEDTAVMRKGFRFLDKNIVVGVKYFLNKLTSNRDYSEGIPKALLFPTRPFNIPEFYLLFPDIWKGEFDIIKKCALAFRGFIPTYDLPEPNDNTDNEPPFIYIPKEDSSSNIRIALTSWKTNEESWVASIVQENDPDYNRYLRLNRLINDVIRSNKQVNYVVFPELSIPYHWFYRLAAKLAQRKISMIAGVEYIHHDYDEVANQVFVSLYTNRIGFPPFVVYRQDKWRPALHEERDLWRIGGKCFNPLYDEFKPCICHGDFVFSILVCSELTNIDYRARLRGRVDALFVVEWNQDTEMFSSLIESSAVDIHSYIIQCNDRSFGDSRIRAPKKEQWERDVIRLKGGVEDYVVIGEINIDTLRRFQSNHRSPEKGKYKPVPDGFTIDEDRRRLP